MDIDIDNLTIKQAREIARMFAEFQPKTQPAVDNGMVGKYVIVRCRDAGVHAGVLEAYNGRECVLTEARRLWYWKPASGAFLSAVAISGLHSSSKIGSPIKVHLTENCEIILCAKDAEDSIRRQESYEP